MDREQNPNRSFTVLATFFGVIFAAGLQNSSAWSMVAWVEILVGFLGLMIIGFGKLIHKRIRINLPSPRLLGCIAGAVLVLAFNYQLNDINSKLDTYVIPRTLTQKQAKQIATELKRGGSRGSVYVIASMADREAGSYADEIHSAIQSAGWNAVRQDVNPWDEKQVLERVGEDFRKAHVALDEGLVLRTCELGVGTAPPSHAVLLNAFGKAGLSNGSGGSSNCTIESLVIEVGHRPVKIHEKGMREAVAEWIFRRLT
jgi:hypothetical protein